LPTSTLIGLLREHISAHLADPDLTVTALARRHHISVRQVHAVFARAGTTPAGFVRQQRLAAARRLLADPAAARRTIAGVAAEVGFPELRTFERAFQRQYGTTPARWRRDQSLVVHRPRRSRRLGSGRVSSGRISSDRISSGRTIADRAPRRSRRPAAGPYG
jgi:AraC-like DNA-binding protein